MTYIVAHAELVRPQRQNFWNSIFEPSPQQQQSLAFKSTPAGQINIAHWPSPLAPNERELVKSTCDPSSMITLSVYQGRSGGYRCSETVIAKELADFMDQHLQACVLGVLQDMGVADSIQKIDVQNLGVISSRVVNTGSRCKGQPIGRAPKSCSVSMHATGRAIDISQLVVTTGQGQILSLPLSCKNNQGAIQPGFNRDCSRQPNTLQGRFYDGFNTCWRQKVVELHNELKPGCGSGLIDCDHNSLHHDHVHLSLPFCPRRSRVSET